LFSWSLKEFRVSLLPTQEPVAEHPVDTGIYEMQYTNIANHKGNQIWCGFYLCNCMSSQ